MFSFSEDLLLSVVIGQGLPIARVTDSDPTILSGATVIGKNTIFSLRKCSFAI